MKTPLTQAQLSQVATNLRMFKAMLPCEQFIVTGSYALNRMGLTNKVHDIDVLLINASVEAKDALFNLGQCQESKHLNPPHESKSEYPDERPIRIMHNDVKYDFWTEAEARELVLELNDGFAISQVPGIVAAKKRSNRFSDWAQLRDIAHKIFHTEELINALQKQA